MQLTTILNRVARNKSFVYGQPRWVEDAPRLTIEVPIRPRANGWRVCSSCGCCRPAYDRLQPRRFEFVPLWQIAFVFVSTMRRANCPRCGVVAERVPWAFGRSRLTREKKRGRVLLNDIRHDTEVINGARVDDYNAAPLGVMST